MRVINTSGGGSTSSDNHQHHNGNGGEARFRRVGSMAGEEGCRMIECSSPARLAVCRLLASLKRCKGGRRVAVVEEKENRGSGRGGKLSKASSGLRDDRVVQEEKQRRMPLEEHRPEVNVSSEGCQRREITFNIAAGLGLLSLIAASKTELDKTIELRKQMEGFLQSIKEEHHSNNSTPKLPIPGATYAVSTTVDGLSNVSPYSLTDHAPSFGQQESGASFVCDQDWNMHEKEVCVDGIDHLEEQLAVELDRLQFDVQKGEFSDTQEVSEEHCSDTVTQSISMSSGEAIIDPQDDDTDADNGGNSEFCGVPPLELERRLHELLETRQEERIRELEAHLERMKRKLQDKEVEVTWWKDTAKLMSQQITAEPSRLQS